MRKKGVFLIYVLFTAVLITVFLLTAVTNIHNSYFITNKFTGENKAYWAAEAGLQYCEYKLKKDLSWPFLDKNNLGNNATGTEQFGKFKVTSSLENGGKGYYIHGVDEKDEEEFHIYFAQKKSENDTNLVPSTFPNESKQLSYCSYNSINQETLLNFTKSNKIGYSDVEYTVSDSPLYKTTIINPGIYIISDGRCRGYKTAIEKMFVADYGNTYGGGIYAGGNIKINIAYPVSRFKINQVSNSRPKVYCKKNFEIWRSTGWNTGWNGVRNNPFYQAIYDKGCPFPLNIADGTLYLSNNPYQFNVYSCAHYMNSQIATNNGNASNGNNNLKQKYGINVEEYKDSDDSLFPQVTWNDVETIKKKEEDSVTLDGKKALTNIPTGSYLAIFNDDEGEKQYELVHIPYNLLSEDGELDKKGLEVLETIRQQFEEKIKKVREDRDSYYRNKRGKLLLTDEAIEQIEEFEDVLKKMETRSGLIEVFASEVGGSVIQSSSTKSELNKILSINTVDIVNVTDIKTKAPKPPKTTLEDDESTNVEEIDDKKLKITYEVKKTPIITLKKSASINGNFNLLTLKISNSGDGFTCDPVTNTSTDLILSEKITGLNESYILAQNNSSTDDKGLYDNLIAGDSVNLYSYGNVTINGKLSGKGQIFSKKSMFFKAGTQLNTNEYMEEDKEKSTWLKKVYTEKENVGEISKVATYSRGSIMMSAPDGEKEEDLNELHNKIKNLLSGKDSTGENQIKEDGISGTTVKDILNNILFSNVRVNEKDLTRVASKIVISHADPKNFKDVTTSLTSEITMNDFKEDIPLLTLMRKYYGFEDREARDYIEEIIQENCNYDDKNNLFKMPTNSDDIVIMSSRSSSSFSGLIYACGGFKCDAKENNIVINGTIVSYGADPSSYSPGSGAGLVNDDLLNVGVGNIEINNCQDFSVVYDSTDLATFVHKNSSQLPIHLSTIYCNKLTK